MALSAQTYQGDGVNTDFVLDFTLGYISTSHIFVFVDDVEEPQNTLTFINGGGSVRLATPPADGSKVLVRRIVPNNYLLHDYENGALVIEENLDESNKQAVMLQHESIDGFVSKGAGQDLDMSGLRITNLADAIDPGDAVNYQTLLQFESQLQSTTAQGVAAIEQAEEDALVDIENFKQVSDQLIIDTTAEFDAQQDAFNDTFDAQFAYARIGNISDYVGDTLQVTDKLNAYQFPDDSDVWYGPIQNQTFPITIPADPATSLDWADVSGPSLEHQYDSITESTWEQLLYKIYRGDAVKIVCLGDSITAGEGVTSGVEDYPTQLKNILDLAYRLNNVTIVNKGVGGNTAAAMIARFQTAVIDENPDAVILMAGMNDIRARSVDQYKSDMDTLFSLCRENGYALLSLGPTPRWRTDNEGYDRAALYNAALESLVSAYNIRYVPLFDKISNIVQATNGFALPDILYDGVHYTPQGYMQIAGAVFAFGMNRGQVGRKLGEFIEPFGGHFSLPTNSTWQYIQGSNSINNSRLLFTKDPGASSMSLMLWVEDYEFCDLVCLASRQQNAAAARSTLQVANRAISETLPDNFVRLSVASASTKTVYGSPVVVETLQPGWNQVQINLASAGTDIYIDGFFISKRDDGVGAYAHERFNAGVRETRYELSDTDANTRLTVMGQEGVLTDGSNRKIGTVTNSTNYPDYYAWYMQINRAATVVLSLGHEMTDNNLYGYAFELIITAAAGSTTMNAVLDIVYRDGSRTNLSTDTFTAVDGDTLRFSLGQNHQRLQVWVKGTGVQIADTDMVVGVSDLNVSISGGDAYIGHLYRLPKNTTGSPQPTTPFDGEQYTDVNSPALVKALGGNFLRATLS